MASKLCLLYLLTVVGLGVVNAAPLELRQPNKAQCGAKQKKLAQDLNQMDGALNQLAMDMNMGNLTDVNNATSLAVDNAADCPPAAVNATEAADALGDGANEKKGKKNGKGADPADAADLNNADNLAVDNAVNATDPALNNADNATDLAADENADCPAADGCTPPAAKDKKKGKAADPVNAMDMGLALKKGGKSRVKVKVNTGGDQNNGEDQNNGDVVQADLNVDNTVVVDPAANNVTDVNNATAVADPLALGKMVGKDKNKGQVNAVNQNQDNDVDQDALDDAADDAVNQSQDNAVNQDVLDAAANNATAVDPTAVNSTAICDPANNATAADPAVNSMKKAKKGVKGAEDALAAMMMGDKSVDMDQVNGNITLAVDAMNEMNLMSNATDKKKMSKVMSMAEDLQNDAKLMENACSNA